MLPADFVDILSRHCKKCGVEDPKKAIGGFLNHYRQKAKHKQKVNLKKNLVFSSF